jgi:prepilin-type N-terminal cleavage/methylation domain-containing protein
MKKEANLGFTLMEILVVVSIIAIMATLATISWQTVTNRGKTGAAYEEMRLLATAETWAHNDTGVFWNFRNLTSPNLPAKDAYADFLGGSVPLVQLGITINSTSWHGPYLSTQVAEKKFFEGDNVVDALGNEYPITAWQILPVFKKGDPCDGWGNPYRLVLLRSDTSASYMVNSTGLFIVNPTDIPITAMIISNGPNGWPEYVVEEVDPATSTYRFKQLSLSEISDSGSPYYRANPAKRTVDDLIYLF